MAVINRVRVVLSGFQGGPGMSTFYCLDPATFLPSLRAFYQAIADDFPAVVTITFPTGGDIVDSTSGVLTGSWATAAPAPVVGTYTGAYAAPVGAVVNWLTGSIINGHRVVGRTFLVPMAAGVFENNGTLNPSAASGLVAASTAFVTAAASNFVIWSRPRAAGVPLPVKPVQAARAGGHVPVTGHLVPDLAAVLRSRRD